MFVVLLKFSDNRDQVNRHMDGHRRWLYRGFDDGVFVLAGALQPSLGGGILAHNVSRADLESWIEKDPFVANDVVRAEIIEIEASKADERLKFLIEEGQ